MERPTFDRLRRNPNLAFGIGIAATAAALLLLPGPVRRGSRRAGMAGRAALWPNRPTPQMLDVLQHLAELGPKPIEGLTAEEARRQPTPADAVRRALAVHKGGAAPEPVAGVEQRTVDGPGGPVPVRIYTPEGDGPFPVIVYWHGGGWVLADLDTYDATPRALANAVGAVVVSAHYRQAPEHPFPAAHEDAFAVYRWVLAAAGTFRGDPGRVAVAGESAGANLAIGTALMARDRGVPRPVHQLLVYPVASPRMDTASYRENAQAKPLNAEMMGWFLQKYLRSDADARDPRIDLLSADLSHLPPATVITAAIDPLRDEGEMLAERLRRHGVEVRHRDYAGVTHEFFGMAALVDEARHAQRLAAARLRDALMPTANVHEPRWSTAGGA
ncbi:MAG TPA: alpha/beta hydrolase [Azospirillaceae bacterium]|nr:alpha/beta hydrolase [Azospirillaceae bacterium]